MEFLQDKEISLSKRDWKTDWTVYFEIRNSIQNHFQSQREFKIRGILRFDKSFQRNFSQFYSVSMSLQRNRWLKQDSIVPKNALFVKSILKVKDRLSSLQNNPSNFKALVENMISNKSMNLQNYLISVTHVVWWFYIFQINIDLYAWNWNIFQKIDLTDFWK